MYSEDLIKSEIKKPYSCKQSSRYRYYLLKFLDVSLHIQQHSVHKIFCSWFKILTVYHRYLQRVLNFKNRFHFIRASQVLHRTIGDLTNQVHKPYTVLIYKTLDLMTLSLIIIFIVITIIVFISITVNKKKL